MGNMRAEERACPRFPSANDASVTIESAPGIGELDGRRFSCRTEDISLRGVRLVLDLMLPVNAAVQLKVTLGGDAHMFQHSGRVAWCRPADTGESAESGRYNAGIEFTTPPGPGMDEWRNALFGLFE